jgi:hypothetical protein
MLLLIDIATRFTDEYILKYTPDAVEKFNEWMALREKESGMHVKRFRTDGGGEFSSKKFAEYLKSEGILKELTTPYIPQFNGVGQWANCKIMECIRCMLEVAGRPKKYWVFEVVVAVYFQHRTPTSAMVGKSPFKAWHGRKLSFRDLRVFGSWDFVHLPKAKQKKVDYSATSGIFDVHPIWTKQ